MSQPPRSPTMRMLIVLLVVALTSLAAFIMLSAWEVLLVLAVLMAIMWGFGALSDLLPMSDATRARLARQRMLKQRYPIYRFRGLFWLGVGIGLGKLWLAYSSGHYAWKDFWPALAFMLVGAIAMLVWRYKYAELARET